MPEVTLRPATMQDAAFLYWVHADSETRRQSETGEVATWEQHVAWLEAAIHSVFRQLFVAEIEGTAIGMGRLDFQADATVISLALAREHRGRGYAGRLIVALLQEALRIRAEAPVLAYVKPQNTRSLRAFLGAGFIPDTDAVVRLRGTMTANE